MLLCHIDSTIEHDSVRPLLVTVVNFSFSQGFTYLPPKSCIPNRANTTMKRKRRNSRLMMDFMELMRETTRFLSEAQYLTERNHTYPFFKYAVLRGSFVEMSRCPTYLVILKILRSLSALSTLIPNDMPGRKKPHTTSKMLPTITCRRRQTHK